MKKKRKRPLAPPPLKSLKRARQVTSAFHAATRALDEALSKGDAEAAASARRAVEAAGGREAYQQASAAATGRHRTASRFVWSHLTRLGLREKRKEKTGDRKKKKNKDRDKPRLLEIGAINTQLLSTPWLQVRSVDLRAPPSGAPNEKKKRKRIEAIDFFDVARLPQRGEFDAVVCSMVLNCLTTPGQRGEMLRGIRRHLRFEEEEEEEEEDGEERGEERGGEEDDEEKGSAAAASASGVVRDERRRGVAFIMLPRRCVEASRACDWEAFERCMARAGLGEVLARKASAKVAFWLVRATSLAAATAKAAIPGPFSSSAAAASGEEEEEENPALIAAAHAAGEFAVSMKEAGGTGGGGGGGGGEKKKQKKKKQKRRTNEEEKNGS